MKLRLAFVPIVLSWATLHLATGTCNQVGEPPPTQRAGPLSAETAATKPTRQSTIEAPPECIATARAIATYLLDDTTNLADDATAQHRWLSTNLQHEVEGQRTACEEEHRRRPTDKIDFPYNGTFLQAWDTPTTFEVLGSRLYDNIALVDLEFTWGAGTEYPGNRRMESYILVLENGSWKLDDVYSFREPFAPPASLNYDLRHYP